MPYVGGFVSSNWFSNRGQIVQTVLAGVACFVAAINAWPNIRDNELLRAGPLVFYALVALVVVALIRLGARYQAAKGERLPSPEEYRKQFALPEDSIAGTLPKTLAERGSIFGAGAAVKTVTVSLGDATEVIVQRKRIEIVLHAISKNEIPKQDEGDYKVELTISLGGAVVSCGKNVTALGVNRFVAPMSMDEYHAEDMSLYSFSGNPNHVAFIYVTVLHANLHKSEATLRVCFLFGYKELPLPAGLRE
jgi:hypothetical protein